MIALTSLTLGILCAGLRSVVGYAVVSFLILATFCIASLNSAGHIGLEDLGIAILGFNVGIACFAVMIGIALYLRRPVNG